MAVTTTGLLIAGLVASLAGTGVAVYSAQQAGKAQQSLNNYNASVNDQAAADVARDGRILANRQREQNEKLKARQRALFAKAGVVTSTGTPLMVQVEQAGELEMNALEVERDANAKAAQARQQAIMDRMAGKSARTTGNLNALSTVLQGTSSALGIGAQIKGYKGVT